MAKKRFALLYPDGSKQHIGCTERDSLLLANLARYIGAERYVFLGQVKTYHSFADLRDLAISSHEPLETLHTFLPGKFIYVDTQGKKHSERLETPEALELRVRSQQREETQQCL